MRIYCPDCGAQAILEPDTWCCKCGGAWEPILPDIFDPLLIDATATSVWRYKKFYDLDFENLIIVSGAGWTPLLPLSLDSTYFLVKPEYFGPTASFKDRGTEVMINILLHQGVTHIAEDSSGNAGASVAAYAARAGLQADIFVPAHASPAKQAQIAVYAAHVNPIPGPRINAKLAAIRSVEKGITFASHAYHPGFLLGLQSIAYELWEQLGHRAPDWYVVPVGQGVHLLAVWLGFQRLFKAGLLDHTPRMVGVQAALLAPLCRAFESGLDTVPSLDPLGTSLAEGLAISQPVRGRRLLQAIRESNGTCIMVEEQEIQAACQQMAVQGFYIEPSSATAIAALKRMKHLIKPGETIVVPLTGSGLKGLPMLSKMQSA